MTLASVLLGRRRLIVTVALLLLLSGVASWFTMPRQEDPTLPARRLNVVLVFPGADAERVERLVVDPVEDALTDVDGILHVRSTARAGVAIVDIELRDEVYDVDAVYDDVREALADVRGELPDAVLDPEVHDQLFDPESIVLMVTGTDDLLALGAAADRLDDRLLRTPGVARTDRLGDPEEQVVITLDPATGRRLGLDVPTLAGLVSSRNVTIPGGTVEVDGRQVILLPLGELDDVDAIRATPIVLPSGAAVPLGELADVRLEPATPASERVRYEGRPAVAVTLVPRDHIDAVAFGVAVREAVAEIGPSLAPLSVHEFAFQPDHVQARIDGLGASLLLGIATVAIFLFLTMGFRMGGVVSAVVPLVTFAAIAGYAATGGVLHQISVAALVLALGLVVDNAIVVSEGVQQHLDRGLTPWEAAAAAIRELAFPLFTATGTTVAAFVPMLLSSGPTADFTRSIPALLIVSLVISYVLALTFTPILSATFLRPGATPQSRLDPVADRLAALGRRPWLVGAGLAGVFVATFGLLGLVDQEFFPLSDRTDVVVTLELPEGTHLSTTDAAARRVEDALSADPRVASVSAFVGRGAPHYYYNLPGAPNSPQLAVVIAHARPGADLDALVAHVRDDVSREVPEAMLVARRLQQGPPVGAPVEVRLSGEDTADLYVAAEAVAGALRDAPHATDVRHDLGLGVPLVQLAIDDAWTSRHRKGRADVAIAVLGDTRGLSAGSLRPGGDAIPVVVRGPYGERTSVDDLAMLDVGTVPLGRLASDDLTWGPAAIEHFDRRRTVTVSAETRDGATFSTVLDEIDLGALALPVGVSLAVGGEAEGSDQANGAIFATLPIGMILLLSFLLVQFDSYRKVAIILGTVPLAAAGVIPGLVLGGQPFGFMSLLGVLALIGIVVNNAIVLLDVIEVRIAAGASTDAAIVEAIRTRIRPILLTTGTTVVGMLPLAFSSSSLWPPLAFAMISGLSASTLLTLVVVPAAFRVLFPVRGVA